MLAKLDSIKDHNIFRAVSTVLKAAAPVNLTYNATFVYLDTSVMVKAAATLALLAVFPALALSPVHLAT